MPLLKQWKEGEGQFAIWKLTEEFGELRSFLSGESYYDEELSLLKSSSRRIEYLGVRVLLKSLCGKEFRILHYVSGKPYLATGEYQLTISHTKGYIAVGIHPNLNIGIDIERYGEKVKRVVSRFIRDDEIPDRRLYSERMLNYQYLLHWSAKETLFKLLDTEGVDFLQHLYIYPFVLSHEGVFGAKEFRTDLKKYFRMSYFLHDDFVCTWALDMKI